MMVHYTALVPVQEMTDALARCVERLDDVLRRLTLPYEIICIDDAALASSAGDRPAWMRHHEHLRIIRFDQARGVGAMLSAGIAASRGDLVIGLCPQSADQPDYVPHLISRLSRFDFVTARPDRTLLETLQARLVSLPSLMAASWRPGHQRPPFFAGRRETVAGLSFGRGAVALLPELVARRGWRVCELTVGGGLPPRGEPLQPGMLRRLAASWHGRRFEPHLASELATPSPPHGVPVASRATLARRGSGAPLPAQPTGKQHGKIA